MAAGQAARSAIPGAEGFPSLPDFIRHRIGRYGLAVLFVVLALIARLLLDPVLGDNLVFSFFLVAVLLTAWTAGIWETLLAIVLGFLAAGWFVAVPRGALLIAQADQQVGATLYLFVSLAIVAFMRSERAGWVQALGRDIEAIKRLQQLEQERSVTTRAGAAREILANLVESARQPILSLDPQGRISTWNAAAERVFGFSAREAATQTLDLLVPPEARMEKENLLTQLRWGEQPGCWHTTLRRKGETRLEAMVYLSPVLDEAGGITGTSVIVCEKPPAGALPLSGAGA